VDSQAASPASRGQPGSARQRRPRPVPHHRRPATAAVWQSQFAGSPPRTSV